ncbi:fibronectin type III domain-containing protein [uncultured Jatrophihabitans sp.]|uniref:fibronectin type III domain-containing protein n=1 Tax=uncultured Jatrophihabitans sp. TaxID=1610747 RepID=UPI0035CC4A70
MPAASTTRPARRQSAALLTLLVVVAAAISTAAYLVQPDRARSFTLLRGSMFLGDAVAPVGVDLASGKPTLRLVGAEKQVGAAASSDVAVVPVKGGTLLVDSATGQFNMVDSTGFVIKHDNGGVPLPARRDATRSTGVAAGAGAFVERTGPDGTDVYLVDQLTVQAATNLTRGVAPRASTRVTAPGTTAPGGAVAADGTFWTLLGTGDRRSVHEFDVSATAARGAALSDSRRGDVSGPAAVGAAGASGAPTGSTAGKKSTGAAALTADAAVGVASANGIRYFGAQAPRDGREVRYPHQAGLDTVLAATSASARLVFLLHGAAGWSVVSLNRDGTGLRGPTPLAGVPHDADLATPAVSAGAAYTVDRASGRLYRIGQAGDAAAVAGAQRYPLARGDGRIVESADFSDAYVTAHGPRVFVDSPSHADAVALFTDGSRRPLTVRKSAAVDVSAAGGAQALARTSATTKGRPKAGPTQRNAGQAINNRVDCRAVDQKPHIPVITQAGPGSRSVALAWNYPLLDSQDCAPSTYVISVKLLSGDAPDPGGSTTVQGQQSTNVTGLYPQSRYQLTVTAYLHGQGTTSAPVQVTTGKEGPAAPTGLQVSADAGGNWHIGFNACGPVASGCVPAASWRIVSSFCDARGLSAPPAPIVAPADPTSAAQPAVTVPGSDALLGRGLRFQIEGTGAAGEIGTPSAQSACVYSWTPPVTSDITVSASTPAHTDTNGSTETTATVHFARGQTHDLGGEGATMTYQLVSGGQVVSSLGPTSSASVTLNGVQPGRSYQVQVKVSPPRHPEAAATIGPVAVAPAIADWPTPTVDASFARDSATSGTVRVTVGLSGNTRGETFDLVGGASRLDCASASFPLTRNDFASGSTLSFSGVSLPDFYTSNGCTVTVQLAQDTRTVTSPALFGAADSAQVTTGLFAIPAPEATTTSSDFSAAWTADQPDPQITVIYNGSDREGDMNDWNLLARNDTSGDCNSTQDAPKAVIHVKPSCVTAGGHFSVQVSYNYFGSTQTLTLPVSGTSPEPVNPANVSFTAAWEDTAQTIDVTYAGSQPLADLQPVHFTETVTSNTQVDPNVDCADAQTNPADASPHPIQIAVDLNACPPTDSDGNPAQYKVEITFERDGAKTAPVDGVPPS